MLQKVSRIGNYKHRKNPPAKGLLSPLLDLYNIINETNLSYKEIQYGIGRKWDTNLLRNWFNGRSRPSLRLFEGIVTGMDCELVLYPSDHPGPFLETLLFEIEKSPLSRRVIEKKAGISSNYLVDIFHRKRSPMLYHVTLIAEVLNKQVIVKRKGEEK